MIQYLLRFNFSFKNNLVSKNYYAIYINSNQLFYLYTFVEFSIEGTKIGHLPVPNSYHFQFKADFRFTIDFSAI
jgi:hypothetical protein